MMTLLGPILDLCIFLFISYAYLFEWLSTLLGLKSVTTCYMHWGLTPFGQLNLPITQETLY